MKTFRVIIDTNVLVAGLRSKRGTAFRLLNLMDSGRFTISVSVPLVVEYEKSLLDSRMRTLLSREEIGKFLDYVCTIADKRKIHFLWRPYLPDPKDDMVLEIGVAARCDAIITFNVRDFASAERFGIRIVTPKQFLTILGERE
jgi:putative PIN family toxin of toxin-antitoxin system